MKCLCQNPMNLEEADDNPYVRVEEYFCECGCSCTTTTFGQSDTPSEVIWYDEDGEVMEVW